MLAALVLTVMFIAGKRDACHAKAFMYDLAGRVKNELKFLLILSRRMWIRLRGDLALLLTRPDSKIYPLVNLNKDVASR
jgi:hypothetical protein